MQKEVKKIMIIKSKQIVIISSCLMMAASLVLAPLAYGEGTTLSVTGNGSESANNVQASTNNTTNVTSNNNATINNTINTQANTGNNTANKNVGETNISTGDVTATVGVTNQANQTQVQAQGCCKAAENTMQINGNGADSYNGVSYSNSQNTTVSINQNANIYNNVYQDLSTGNNKANRNVGDVSIKTGSITSEIKVKNASVNIAKVKTNNSLEDFLLKITENGYGSYNDITVDENYQTDIDINNDADVITELVAKFETGNNKANDNVGEVDIVTGAIDSFIEIINELNVSEVEAACDNCKEDTSEEKPHGGEKMVPQAQVNAGNNGTTSDNKTEHQSENKGPILPITGNNWLILALFGNIMMLLLGAYLRLRSGRSPGLVTSR